MVSAMCADAFLEQRSPELLSGDLKIASLLLRTGLKQEWTDSEGFLVASRTIWASLVFSSTRDPLRGWLERRYQGANDPHAFALRMASPELSAPRRRGH